MRLRTYAALRALEAAPKVDGWSAEQLVAWCLAVADALLSMEREDPGEELNIEWSDRRYLAAVERFRSTSGEPLAGVDRCWAYTGAGTVCGAQAVAVDESRGITVCAEHAPAGLLGARPYPEGEETVIFDQ